MGVRDDWDSGKPIIYRDEKYCQRKLSIICKSKLVNCRKKYSKDISINCSAWNSEFKLTLFPQYEAFV